MSEHLRRRRRADRRVLWWCFGIAALVHGAVFALFPSIRSRDVPFPLFSDDLEVDEGAIPLDLFFGPPAIADAEGVFALEPPERVLEADRLVFLAPGCRAIIVGSGAVIRGTVRLAVRSNGLADVVGVVRSTGSDCGDAAMERVAGDLWYRWLPSDEFPAPVELIQAVTIAERGGL